MGFGHGKNAKLYVGGWDLSSYMTSVSTSGKADVAEVSPLGTTDKQFLNGMITGSLTGEGFYTDGPNEVASVMGSAFAGTSILFSHLPQGDVFGSRQVSLDGSMSDFAIDTDTGNVGKISVSASSKEGFATGVILAPLGSHASPSGTGTALNDVTAATNGSADGFLHVSASTGGNLVVKIQHSSDNISYVDLITFATVSSAHQSQRLSSLTAVPTGLVNKWLKMTYTLSAGSATFFVALTRLIKPH